MRINPRFRKSVHVELDYLDPRSTSDYVATDFVLQSFKWIGNAFAKGSTQRAWRLTGDYGSGKSAFALALAKVTCGKSSEVPAALRKKISSDLHPVFVTGDREPLHVTIGKALIRQIPLLKKGHIPSSSSELMALLEFAQNESSAGLFIILDELGKNLEQAMMEPSSSDVYVLQLLAEMAARSGEKPFVVLAILHMGISAYTSDLDTTTRKEWDKVAGRFDELLFQHPFEQTVQLCAEAIGLETERLPRKFTGEASDAMKWAVESDLYGSAPAQSLQELAPRIFPLHPVALPPLMKLLRRFGQNERSLFSFLAGHEPASLQEIAGLGLEKARFFRLADLFNFFQQNIAHTISNGRATHWRIIESVVRKAVDADEAGLLKSIGILNLLDDDGMLATRDLLIWALGNNSPAQNKVIHEQIEKLKARHLLFERGAVRGFALWPHTSVHLDDAFELAKQELGEPPEPMQLVASKLDPRQLVARRHYIETGNLRHFELQFHPAKTYSRICEVGPSPNNGAADGFVLILLPETEREHQKMLATLKEKAQHPGPSILVGLIRPPLELLGVAKDLQAWQHIRSTVKELSSDEFARRELSAQIRSTTEKLNELIDALLGWNQNPKQIAWFRGGKPEEIADIGLSSRLSGIAEEIYSKCPIITNELINRRNTSSAASRARTMLVEAIARNPEKEILGMDDSKNPPEMAIYLSVLKAGKLHVQDEHGWKFVIPEEGRISDPCCLRPAFNTIENILKNHDAQRVQIPIILTALRAEPLGARDGLIPLILALYIAARRNQTALFEDLTYIPNLDGETVQRLTKEPEAFELQYCAIEGDRMETFEAIAKIFGVTKSKEPAVLEVVRPLMEFVASLPEYSRNTKKLSAEAKNIRAILIGARDPARLIFQDLPDALPLAKSSTASVGSKLTRIIAELNGSYDALLARLGASIREAFGTSSKISDFRNELIARGKAIANHLVESDLKSFVLRLGDAGLEHRQWLESLANHLSKKTASKWMDSDEEVFNTKLVIFAQRMLRAEAAQGDVTRSKIEGKGDRVLRLMLTKPDGNEHGELLHWSEAEDTKVSELEAEISRLIKSNGRAGLGAAASALWNNLQSQ